MPNLINNSIELDNCAFHIGSYGITYMPFVGSGDEKDKDWFISYDDLKRIFMEERDR